MNEAPERGSSASIAGSSGTAVALDPALKSSGVGSNLTASQRTRLGWVIVFLALLLLPILDGNNADLDSFANAGTFVLLALGLNIVVGFAGLLDLGYAAFFALGAYAYGLAASFQLKPEWSVFWAPFEALGQVTKVQFGEGAIAQLHFSYWIMVPIAAIFCAGWGALFGLPTLRLRGDYLAIVTLGFGEIVPLVLRNASDITNGAQGLPGVKTPMLFGIDFGFSSLPFYYTILAFVAVIVFVSYRLQYSRTGRAWLALREDELAASTMGINHVRYKLLAFASGAAIGGMAGTFYVAKLTTATPDMFQFSVSTIILVMVVLGGMGSIPGVMIGAVILTIFQSIILGQLNVWGHSLGASANIGWLTTLDLTQLNELIFGIVLVAMMLYRRQGLIPARRAQGSLSVTQQVVQPSRGGFVGDFQIAEKDSTIIPDEPLLIVKGLEKRFGGVTAANKIDFEIYPGEVVSVIGPNGSGKTTFFNLLTGLYRADGGEIRFQGIDITRLPPYRIAELGISRTFQNLRLFNNLTVLENALIGQHHRLRASSVGAIFRPPSVKREEKSAVAWAAQVLGLFGNRLIPRLDHVVTSLSYANRRRTEIARAMVARPKLLLLDEPSAGMNPAETLELMDQIQSMRGFGLTVLLIEHKLQIVNTISDRVVVLDYGVKIAEGTAAEVQKNPRVIEAYLGRTGTSG